MEVIVNHARSGITRQPLPDNSDQRSYDLDQLGHDVATGKARWFMVVGAGAAIPDLLDIVPTLDPPLIVVEFEDTGTQETGFYESEELSILAAEEADGLGVTATRRPATLAERVDYLRGDWCIVQYRDPNGELRSARAMPREADDNQRRRYTRSDTGTEMWLDLDQVVSIRKVTDHDNR